MARGAQRHWGRGLAVVGAVALAGWGGGLALVVATALPAAATVETLYVTGGASATSGCTMAAPCGLITDALAVAGPGDTVVVTGTVDEYGIVVTSVQGNAVDPLSIVGSGVSPSIDGTDSGEIFSVDAGVGLSIQGLTLENGAAINGGAIDAGIGGTASSITVSDCTFTDDTATGDGGAIDNGDNGGTGSVVVSGSTFTGDTADGDGGAIDNGDNGGGGSVTVSDSTFTDDATTGEEGEDGGAIASGANSGGGSVSVSSSTFTDNTSVEDGGAIDSNDDLGHGSVTVSGSTFTTNTSDGDGGAIDSGDYGGGGSVTVSGSTFTGNMAEGYNGGAIDSGDDGGGGTVTVSDSTFTDNSATNHGGAIDSGDEGGSGSVTVADSTFTANTAPNDGDVIDSGDSGGGGSVAVAGDVLAGSCAQVGGSWYDGGYNVGSDTSCFTTTDTPATDVDAGSNLSADFGALAANGGPTETQFPLGGAANPAVGIVLDVPTTVTVEGSQIALCPRVDQRGVPSAGACSAGAVEDVPGVPPALPATGSATFTPGEAGSVTITSTGNVPTPSLSESGTIPAGLSFTDNGNGTATIAGTPDGTDTPGGYPVTVSAANGVPPAATDSFTITLAAPPPVAPASVTVTVAGTQVAGSTSPTFTYTPETVAVSGTATCVDVIVDGTVTPITAALAAGSYTLDAATCSGLSPTSPDSVVSYLAGSFTVTAAAPTPAPTIATTSRTGRGTVTITGTATPGTTVALYGRAYDATAATALQTTVSSVTGGYRFAAYIRRTTTFATITPTSLPSLAVTATVTDRVTEHLTGRRRTVTATVRTDPSVHDVTVTLYRLDPNGTRVRLRTVTVTNPDGTLNRTLHVKRSTITIEAAVAAGDGTAGGTSTSRTVHVKH